MKVSDLRQTATNLLRQGNYTESVYIWEECVDLSEDISDCFYLGLAMFLNGQILESELLWLSTVGENDLLIKDLVKILEVEAGWQPIQSQLIYYKILQIDPTHSQAYYYLINSLLKSGEKEKIDEALRLWKQTANINVELHDRLSSIVVQELAVHTPDVFYVNNLSEAKSIILTPDYGSSEERWQTETPYLIEQLGDNLQPNSNNIILDYGCGVGRLAKEIIAKYGCTVIGVDISNQMLQLAVDYVKSENFITCSPQALEQMVEKGLKVDHAYSIWVLQHCLEPIIEINRIKKALKELGYFYVVNSWHRSLPGKNVWYDDKIDVADILRKNFKQINSGTLSNAVVTTELSNICFWINLQKVGE